MKSNSIILIAFYLLCFDIAFGQTEKNKHEHIKYGKVHVDFDKRKLSKNNIEDDSVLTVILETGFERDYIELRISGVLLFTGIVSPIDVNGKAYLKIHTQQRENGVLKIKDSGVNYLAEIPDNVKYIRIVKKSKSYVFLMSYLPHVNM